MNEERNEDRLDQNNRKLLSTLWKVAMPIALQSLIGSSLNLVDNLMVGSLGEAPLAAVGVSVQIYFVFFMICFGFSTGCSTFMAQFWGKKDLLNIRRTTGFNFTICFIVGLGFFVAAMFFPSQILRIFTNIPEVIDLGVQYVRVMSPCFLFMAIITPLEEALRATQQTHLPLIASMSVFGTNTFLNYIFIFGNFGAPKLGVTGAALATTSSRVIQIVILFIIVFGLKNKIAGKLRDFFSWNKDLAKRIIKNAIPTTMNEMLWGLGMAMYTAAFARIGVTEYASVQAANTIMNILQLTGFSIGTATLILVGQRLGQGRLDEAYHLAGKLMKIDIVAGLVLGGILIAISKPIISLFDFTPQGTHYTFLLLLIYGCTMALTLYNGQLVVGVLRSGGDTRFAMIAETSTVWLIGVPLAFLTATVLHWPIFFCVLAIRFEEVVKCILLTWRFFTKKWVNNVVNDIGLEDVSQSSDQPQKD